MRYREEVDPDQREDAAILGERMEAEERDLLEGEEKEVE